MGDKVILKVDERDIHGKKVAKLRQEGLVPAVIYGPGIEPLNVQVPHNIVEKVYQTVGKHAPVHLVIGTKKKIAMIKDVEINPIRRTISHVSFHAVKASDPVVAEVPIRLVGEGESEAEKAGLIVLQALEKIEVRALPMDLPDAVEVDITELKEPGQKVTLGEASLPVGVEFVGHESGHGDEAEEDRPRITDLTVASVWEPAALQAANESSAGQAEDEADVEAEHGEDTDQASQAAENRPGGKGQDEPKQSNIDAAK